MQGKQKGFLTLKNWYVKGTELCGDLKSDKGFVFYCSPIRSIDLTKEFQILTKDGIFYLKSKEIEKYYEKSEIVKRLEIIQNLK